MATEIERKFLVRTDIWKPSGVGNRIRQGYLRADAECTVRVRTADRHATLTVKVSSRTLARHEFEYEIPRGDAESLLALCGPLVEKTRHRETVDSHVWEIDVFHGENEGLVVAEIEVSSENETFAEPPWLGAEVSNEARYFNATLARHPYRKWKSGTGP